MDQPRWEVAEYPRLSSLGERPAAGLPPSHPTLGVPLLEPPPTRSESKLRIPHGLQCCEGGKGGNPEYPCNSHRSFLSIVGQGSECKQGK